MVIPYIHFAGQCEEAFQFYAKAFGGEILDLVHYGETTPGIYPDLTDETRGWVMHAQMALGGGQLSGSDNLDPEPPVNNRVSLHVLLDDLAVAQHAFAALSEGGTVLNALTPNPPPHDNGGSGCLIDKYGFYWIITAPFGAK